MSKVQRCVSTLFVLMFLNHFLCGRFSVFYLTANTKSVFCRFTYSMQKDIFHRSFVLSQQRAQCSLFPWISGKSCPWWTLSSIHPWQLMSPYIHVCIYIKYTDILVCLTLLFQFCLSCRLSVVGGYCNYIFVSTHVYTLILILDS